MKIKKITAFALAVVSVMSVASCSKNAKESKKEIEMSSADTTSVADRAPEVTSEADTTDTTEESTAESTEETSESEVTNTNKGITFSDLQGEYEYSTGAGGWYTEFTLNADGTFEGDYHHHGFEDGVEYADVCDFSGVFTMLEKIDNTTYSMRLERIELIDNVGTVNEEDYLPDEVRVSYTDYVEGLNSGKDFMVYLPGTKPETLDESILTNTYEYMYGNDDNNAPFSFTVIYNKDENAPFCSRSN